MYCVNELEFKGRSHLKSYLTQQVLNHPEPYLPGYLLRPWAPLSFHSPVTAGCF